MISLPCPECGSGETRIRRTNKRNRPKLDERLHAVFRWYSCPDGHRFVGVESVLSPRLAEYLDEARTESGQE